MGTRALLKGQTATMSLEIPMDAHDTPLCAFSPRSTQKTVASSSIGEITGNGKALNSTEETLMHLNCQLLQSLPHKVK